MSIKEEFEKIGGKMDAETESVGWVHDERVIEHEKEKIAQTEKNMKRHEDVLEADKQLKNGFINRIEDDIEEALVRHDQNVIEAAEEKIASEEKNQQAHQAKIDTAKEKVETIEDKQASQK